jgi:hypothetical protein
MIKIFCSREKPYEHIPDELTNPRIELLKKLSPGKLLRKIKERRQKQKETGEKVKDKNQTDY